jgi:choloylglycine hydrolase
MCTRVLWNTEELAVITGRTMDWPDSTQPQVTVFPRGLERDGGNAGPIPVVAENPVRWVSRFGSIVCTVYGVGAADGFNERGLAAHMLYLTGSDFGPRDPAHAGLFAALWAQYLLDNAATVTEALQLMDEVQLVGAEVHGFQTTVHLAIEDASGDSAILEVLDGSLVVHHGRQYTLMTNDPRYEVQLELLAGHDFSAPTSDTPLPGNVNPRDRFARAAYYSAMLPEPRSEREAVASMFAIVRNVSVPFGAPYKDFGIYNTEYRTVTDLTNHRYYFELTTSPNVIWADLDAFALEPGASVMTLDPDDIDLAGNVSSRFDPMARAPF